MKSLGLILPLILALVSVLASGSELGIVYAGAHSGAVRAGGCELLPRGGVAAERGLVTGLRERLGDNLVVLAGGTTFVPRKGTPWIPAAQDYAKALRGIGFDAVAPSHQDFALGGRRLAGLARRGGLPLISANAYDRRTGRRWLPSHRLLKRGSRRVIAIGIAGAEGKPHPDLELREPAAEIERVLQETGVGRGDLVVVLSMLPREALQEISRRVPDVGMFLGSDPALPSGDVEQWSEGTLYANPSPGTESVVWLRLESGGAGRFFSAKKRRSLEERQESLARAMASSSGGTEEIERSLREIYDTLLPARTAVSYEAEMLAVDPVFARPRPVPTLPQGG